MDATQEYKCPCCGAPLVFDAGTQNLHCESCGNDFSIDTMQLLGDGLADAGVMSKYDWKTYTPRNYDNENDVRLADYTCPSCGAEITGDDNLGSTVCPYCGNSTFIKGQFEGALRPDYIIPFKIDKKHAVSAFEQDSQKRPFLPDSFSDRKKIEEMAGVYVPFWMFDCDCNAAVAYNAEMTTAWEDSTYDYVKTDYYKLFRKGRIGFANIPVDGSTKADDKYMEAVEPYKYNDAVEFSGAYLSGYLADKYDVDAEDSIDRANERVKNSTIRAFKDTTSQYSSVEEENARVEFSDGKIRYALLPAWMFTFKYMDELYRFAVNGQTGKVAGEYPVDNGKKRKYFAKIAGLCDAVAAVAGFLLLK